MVKIPYGKQCIENDDIEAVVEVLKSDFLTQGPAVEKFEREFAASVGAKYAVATCNATAALHLCFKILNQGLEKKVLVTPITFAASSNCVLFERGQVEFVDIDPRTFNIDLGKLEEKISADPKAYQGIIPVDFAGLPVDTEKLRALADQYGLWVIEDACHAIGGGFHDSKGNFIKCGSGVYSDLTTFSFHPVKHIATGEGGMITTNNERHYRHLLNLRSHGIERSADGFESASQGGWYHEMQELGYNYRMSDINAALGLSQLKKLAKNIANRSHLASKYREFFSTISLGFQDFDQKKFVNAYHLFVVQTDRRKELYDYLKDNDVYAQVHYLPVYRHPHYRRNGFEGLHLEHAERYYERALSLPMYHAMGAQEQERVIDLIKRF